MFDPNIRCGNCGQFLSCKNAETNVLMCIGSLHLSNTKLNPVLNPQLDYNELFIITANTCENFVGTTKGGVNIGNQ